MDYEEIRGLVLEITNIEDITNHILSFMFSVCYKCNKTISNETISKLVNNKTVCFECLIHNYKDLYNICTCCKRFYVINETKMCLMCNDKCKYHCLNCFLILEK